MISAIRKWISIL